MRAHALTAVLVAVAGCDASGTAREAATTSAASEILGGMAAPAGKWPDVASVRIAGLAACTGTLIAANVVLTAGHCNDPELDSVLLGAASLARPQDGETIAVAERIEYESSPGAGDSFETEDLLVVVLASESTVSPRPLATGWARFEIVNGAQVTIAGYGATNPEATMFVSELQEAVTTITDAECIASPGCNESVAPGGELGAGGMGIDTCLGDSGGPLYLMTASGELLAGVTSREYEGAMPKCGGGGIYARPDKVIDWIEAAVGGPVARAPGPAADPICVVRGHAGETTIAANDPRDTTHAFAIAAPPRYATAKLRDDGQLRVCTDPSFVGTDYVVVRVTDERDQSRAIDLEIPIYSLDGEPATACDVDDFDGGCCDSGRGSRSSAALGLGALVLVTRRRRR